MLRAKIKTSLRTPQEREQDRKNIPTHHLLSLSLSLTLNREGRPDGRTAAARLAKGTSGPGAGTGHKLGPKANQGAINAGLRALDRTGKRCRKWEKTGFHVKSFTGRIWEIPSWKAPTPKAFGSEADSGQGTPNSQSKGNTSSNIGSDKSPAVNPSNIASSPAPGVATPA